MKKIIMGFFFCLVFVALGCATFGHKTEAPVETAVQETAPIQEEYIIGPEDLLVVSVWKDESLTIKATVRSDGKISVPLINDVQASGLTVLQLKDEITNRLNEFIPEVEVTVVVEQMNSNRIYVQGEVTRPGPIPFNGDLTVIQALAMAGGLTPYADRDSIIIIRADGEKLKFNYNQVIRGKKTEQNVKLKRWDTIIVP